MDVSSLPQLPAVLAGSALVISQAVFGLLLLFQTPLASVPGLRASDGTRNAFLRSLVFVLNLSALVGLAWSQNVVIPRADLPALLATAAVAGTVSTGSFFAKKAIANKQSATAAPATVPPLPADAQPVPAAPAQS